jgi:hypothetical protein
MSYAQSSARDQSGERKVMYSPISSHSQQGPSVPLKTGIHVFNFLRHRKYAMGRSVRCVTACFSLKKNMPRKIIRLFSTACQLRSSGNRVGNAWETKCLDFALLRDRNYQSQGQRLPALFFAGRGSSVPGSILIPWQRPSSSNG